MAECHPPYFMVAWFITSSLVHVHIVISWITFVSLAPYFLRLMTAQLANICLALVLYLIFGRAIQPECGVSGEGTIIPGTLVFPALEWQLTAFLLVLVFYQRWQVHVMYYRALALASVWMIIAFISSRWFYPIWSVILSIGIGTLFGVLLVRPINASDETSTSSSLASDEHDAEMGNLPIEKDTTV